MGRSEERGTASRQLGAPSADGAAGVTLTLTLNLTLTLTLPSPSPSP